MKKTLLALAFLFAVSPAFVSAQTTLSVYSPSQGAQVNYNQTYTISWSPVSGANTMIVYIEQSDGSYRQEIGSTPAVNTNMDWRPDSLQLKSGQYRLYIKATGGTADVISHGYSGFFSIVGNEPQTVPVNLKVSTNVQGNSSWITAYLAGYSTNNNVSYWKLLISCQSGVVVSGKFDQNLCGTELRMDRYNINNPTQDYLWFSAGAKNNSSVSANVVLAVTAYDSNGNNIGGDKDGFTLGADTPTQTIATPTQPVTVTISYVQSPAEDRNILHPGERATVYGSNMPSSALAVLVSTSGVYTSNNTTLYSVWSSGQGGEFYVPNLPNGTYDLYIKKLYTSDDVQSNKIQVRIVNHVTTTTTTSVTTPAETTNVAPATTPVAPVTTTVMSDAQKKQTIMQLQQLLASLIQQLIQLLQQQQAQGH